jgi:L-iditol 2-dehydrogenase
MRAAVLKGIEDIKVIDVPTPACPEDGLLLKVRACGICGGDVRRYFFGLAKETSNSIMGHEVTGEVVEVGKEVEGFRCGDRLALAADIHCGHCYYCQRSLFNLCENLKILGREVPGGFAEFIALPGEVLKRGVVNRLPANLSFTDGALSEPMCSVLAAQDTLGVGLQDIVVVFGAGPIGCLHVEIAHLRGAKRVILIEPFVERAEKAKKLFHVDTIATPEEADAVVKEETDGIGVDVAIVATGVSEASAQAVRLVRKRGRVAVFGGLPKHNSTLHLDGNRIHYDEISVLGTFSYHPIYHKLALELLSTGRIDPKKFIKTYPLEDVKQAIWDAREGRVFKAVLLP